MDISVLRAASAKATYSGNRAVYGKEPFSVYLRNRRHLG